MKQPEGKHFRLFIALELPDAIRKGAAALSEDFKSAGAREGLGWARPEGMHLTLKFLGPTPEERVPELAAALRRACEGQRPFELCFAGVGTFPPRGRPRVLWVGAITGAEQTIELQRRVEEQIAPLGFPGEQRPFAPHLTLCRVKAPPGGIAIAKLLPRFESRELGCMPVDRLHLYRSELRPGGAVYTSLAEAPLSP